MIAKIKGELTHLEGKEGIVDTASGVSYLVRIPSAYIHLTLPSPIDIFTYLHVREDAMVLYGFESFSQYKFFHLLLSVDGVGPKTAHTILDSITISQASDAVYKKDISVFTNISGLGKKTAQKIILELASKLKSDLDVSQIIESPLPQEAYDALLSLGFKSKEATQMLKNIDLSLSPDQMVREALKHSPHEKSKSD